MSYCVHETFAVGAVALSCTAEATLGAACWLMDRNSTVQVQMTLSFYIQGILGSMVLAKYSLSEALGKVRVPCHLLNNPSLILAPPLAGTASWSRLLPNVLQDIP